MTAPAPKFGRRKYSLWTLLAPAALIVTVMLVANALGGSGVFDDAKTKASNSAKDSSKQQASTTAEGDSKASCVPPVGKKQVKVAAGQTLSVIAENNCTTVEKLQELNPKLSDPQRLQPGDRVIISAPTTATGDADAEAVDQ